MRVVIGLLAALLFASLAHAGAWGEGSFENDDALDWVAECTGADSLTPVATALDAALRAKTLEAPEGSVAIAAAEVVAAALGRPTAKLPPEMGRWVRRQSSEQLVRLAPVARKALARIRDPKVSELRQLWDEGKPNKWLDLVAELEARLGK